MQWLLQRGQRRKSGILNLPDVVSLVFEFITTERQPMDDPIIQHSTAQDAEDVITETKYKLVGKCEIEVPQPAALIIFGASGDLTKRKLFPALYQLFKSKMLSEQFFILGTSRVKMSTDQFRGAMLDAVKETSSGDFAQLVWDEFAPHIYYSPFDYADPASYTGSLRDILPGLESRHQTGGNRVFSLAIPPTVFEPVIHNLGAAGLSREDKGRSHVVIEKPFGHDLASARRLNQLVIRITRRHRYSASTTIWPRKRCRIFSCFGSPIPSLNRFGTGATSTTSRLRRQKPSVLSTGPATMKRPAWSAICFQNHMLQLICLTALEPPAVFTADRVQDEKAKVLRSLRKFPLDRLGDHRR